MKNKIQIKIRKEIKRKKKDKEINMCIFYGKSTSTLLNCG